MTKIRLILNSEISKKEILKCVKSLKNDKAFTDDLIINEYIRRLGTVILTKIYGN
jgi:hypothetical protein